MAGSCVISRVDGARSTRPPQPICTCRVGGAQRGVGSLGTGLNPPSRHTAGAEKPPGVPRVQRKNKGMASTRPPAYAKPHAGAHNALPSANTLGAIDAPSPAAHAVPSRGPRRHGALRRADHHHITHRTPLVTVAPQRHHPHQHSTTFNLHPACHLAPTSNPSSAPPQTPRPPRLAPSTWHAHPTPPPFPHAAPSRHTMPTDRLPPRPPPHLMPPRTA